MKTKNAKRLNLAQCIRLQQNNFLTVDLNEAYDHNEVIDQMIKLQSDKDIKKLQRLMREELLTAIALEKKQLSELPPPIPFEASIDYCEDILF
jgi:hypothetical protein